MATREQRLSEFDSGEAPADGAPREILCEDHVGTYAPPFLAVFKDDRWHNARTMQALDVTVVGWRTPRPHQPMRTPPLPA
jgi:hypothetical protein